MKSKRDKRRNDYTKLKRKVFFQMLLITVATAVTVYLLRFILRGQIGDRLVLLFRFSVSWFTKYFDEISSGMDELTEESDDEIILSPELDFMENKLNQIKYYLEKQKKAALDAEQRKNDSGTVRGRCLNGRFPTG